MELITINFAAPGTKRFERAGRYIEVIDAAAAFDLILSDASGGQVDYAKGALSGIWLAGAFAAIDLASTVAQNITLLITDGQGGSRRQPGVVRVVDQGAEKTRALGQYVGTQTYIPPAGKTALAGIKAVGGEVAVKRLSLFSPTAGQVLVYSATGNPTSGDASESATGFANKYLGAATGTKTRTVQGSAAGTAPTVGELPGRVNIFSIYVAANVQTDVPLDTPLIVPAGVSLVACGAALDRTVGLFVDVEEL